MSPAAGRILLSSVALALFQRNAHRMMVVASLPASVQCASEVSSIYLNNTSLLRAYPNIDCNPNITEVDSSIACMTTETSTEYETMCTGAGGQILVQNVTASCDFEVEGQEFSKAISFVAVPLCVGPSCTLSDIDSVFEAVSSMIAVALGAENLVCDAGEKGTIGSLSQAVTGISGANTKASVALAFVSIALALINYIYF